MWWIIGGVVVVLVLASVAYLAFKPPNPEVGNRAKLERTYSAAEQERLDSVTISRADLATATCDDPARCWVGIDGVVYDMSDFPSWARGTHHGVRAGADETEKFVRSGHARAYLQKMPVVGRLQA